MLIQPSLGDKEILPESDMMLWPDEKVIWTHKPEKKAFLYPTLGVIPLIVIVFISVSIIISILIQSFQASLFLFFIIIILIFLGIPTLYRLKKYENTEYILTNQRLILKSEFSKEFSFLSIFDKMSQGRETWFAELGEIKDLKVKKDGFRDKIFGTASIYPITPDFPYPVKIYPNPYSDGRYRDVCSTRVYDVYNIVSGENEKVPHVLLWEKTFYRPRMVAIKSPIEVAKFLREKIDDKSSD